jgi:hypothetical protein
MQLLLYESKAAILVNIMKYIFYYFIISTCLVLSSCNVDDQTNHKGIDTTNVIASNNAENLELKEIAFKRLNILEQLFGNENYLVVNGKDSSFLYFTRLGKNDFFTHSYKLVKGDSTQLHLDTIQINNSNQVQWNFKRKQLILQDCNETKAQWQNNADANDKVDFQKINQKRFNLSINGQQYLLSKTLAISLFLVRTHYDFEHHTNFAFDTTNFTKKH